MRSPARHKLEAYYFLKARVLGVSIQSALFIAKNGAKADIKELTKKELKRYMKLLGLR